jgi:hypothetical protein
VDLCTIVARNYLPYARVLADSFLDHHPGSTCHVLVLDGPQPADAPAHVRYWTPETVAIPDLPELAAGYEITELATAVKPAFLARLLAETQDVIYLDPDIRIYAPLTTVVEQLERAPIVLNPHLAQSLPDDGKRPDDQDILLAGAYNLGFLALRRGTETDRLLAWWSRRLKDACRIDIPAGLFVDQRWIDLVPGLFDVAILRDPGCNVAYWNLPHRVLSRDGDRVVVNGEPLRFFHFSGFDCAHPDRLSRHQTRDLVARDQVLAQLLRAYAAEVGAVAATMPKPASAPYGFAHLPNGMALTYVVRAGYRRWRREGAREDVWSAGGAEALARWLGEPEPRAPPGVSRFLHELRAARRDLLEAFPADADGTNRYLGWVHERGVVEVDIPERFLPPPPGGAVVIGGISVRRRAYRVRQAARLIAKQALLRYERR